MTEPFTAIATTRLRFEGPFERPVVVEIGAPETKPGGGFGFRARCPYRILGMANDSIQYAPGIDTFHALKLAFLKARNTIEAELDVLVSYFPGIKLVSEEEEWSRESEDDEDGMGEEHDEEDSSETEDDDWRHVFPVWILTFDSDDLREVELLSKRLAEKHDYWTKEEQDCVESAVQQSVAPDGPSPASAEED